MSSPANPVTEPPPETPAEAGLSGQDRLTWLFLYRLVLVALLLLLFSFPGATPWLAIGGDPSAARLLLAVQAVLVLISGLLILARWPGREQQVELAVFLDIGMYILLMHLSGGNGTGLGLLPAIAVTAGALLMEGRLSLLFAALATLGVIAQQVYTNLYAGAQSGTYIQAGLLGLTFFSVALLAHVLSRRLRETERLAARRKVDIADLSKLNEYVIQSLATGVVVVDGDRNLLLLNSAARRLLGTPEARRGDPLFRLAPTLRDWFLREIHGRNALDSVIELGGQEVRPSLHLLGDHRANGALIYLRDNQELLRQAHEIKLAALGRLTASIAHNIRNPLSSVTHAAQLLAEAPALPEEERHLLEIIRRNALRIDETVTSVLELSRRQQPQPQSLELRAWLTEFADEYRDGNRLPPGTLRLSLPPVAATVRLDPRHLGQILRNLCDNACKHGLAADGLPRVRLILARSEGDGALRLHVVDEGPGVAPEHRRSIFEPFFTTSSSGTGLGLYAARELAEANGMRLEYADEAPAGGEFRLIFAG